MLELGNSSPYSSSIPCPLPLWGGEGRLLWCSLARPSCGMGRGFNGAAAARAGCRPVTWPSLTSLSPG